MMLQHVVLKWYQLEGFIQEIDDAKDPEKKIVSIDAGKLHVLSTIIKISKFCQLTCFLYLCGCDRMASYYLITV